MDKLYLLEINEDEVYDLSYILKLISKKKQEQIRNFRFDNDKKLSLYPDILIRYIACNYFNLSNSELEFSKNEFGKPYLVGYPNFCYNISHTRNAILVGISDEKIGVDIEKIGMVNFSLVKRFFTPAENNYVLDDKEIQDKRFYEIWTQKEAYIKWQGQGLSLPLNSFCTFAEGIREQLFTFVDGEYICSICSNQTKSTHICIKIQEEDIIEQSHMLSILENNQ